MGLAYDDLIEPVIVRQESRSRFYCMCGRTRNFPFCDGSHKVTSITPREITVDEPRTMAICACWRSKTRPYCDGTHGKLVADK